MLLTGRQFALVFGSSLLLSTGCAPYQPRSLDPAAELAALSRRGPADVVVVDRAALGDANPAIAAEALQAFDVSDGLNEAEVVAVALTLSPDLRAKRAGLGEARALLVTAGLWPNPEVGVGLRPGVGGSSGYKLQADALVELLRPGERAARRAVAEARVEEFTADVVADEYRAVAEVRAQWLAVLAAEQAVRLLDEEVVLRERSVDLVRQRRGLGEGTELEASVAELELAELRRDRRKAQAETEARRRELNRLMGLPPEYELRLSDSGRPLTVTVYDDPTDDELDRRILGSRPELRAKSAAYRRAEEELRLAVLGQYPRLKVGPSFERELDGGKSLGLGLSVELPLLNQNQGEVAEKLAQRDRLRAEYAAVLHRLRAAAHAARGDLRRARAEVDAQEREVLPLVKRNQELFEGAYRARDLSVVDWVTAQQRAVRARREYQESLVRYRNALVRLEAAAGLPFSRPAPTTGPAAATRPVTTTQPNR